jgi:hypothetical protein
MISMTRLHQTVEDMLTQLGENSRTEIDLVRALSDAIRRVDEHLLREIRSVALQHDIRREAILGELQTLASRLCYLPARGTTEAIEQQANYSQQAIDAQAQAAHGADWRQATQNIHDEFDFPFNGQSPRH